MPKSICLHVHFALEASDVRTGSICRSAALRQRGHTELKITTWYAQLISWSHHILLYTYAFFPSSDILSTIVGECLFLALRACGRQRYLLLAGNVVSRQGKIVTRRGRFGRFNII